MDKQKASRILDLLKGKYPDAGCALDYTNTFELLVAVCLSAQTTDVSVNKVTPALFAAYPESKDLAEAYVSDVAELIKTIGMYRQKAKRLVELSRALCEKYNGNVPKEYDELIKLPGVGRKTANVVMSVGFGKQAIAVDTHVFRVANRIGLTESEDVLKTEFELMKIIPKDRWTEAHHSLIFHGRNCCKARKPACDTCIIEDLCDKKI